MSISARLQQREYWIWRSRLFPRVKTSGLSLFSPCFLASRLCHPPRSSDGRMTFLIFLYGASDSILFAPSKTLIVAEFHLRTNQECRCGAVCFLGYALLCFVFRARIVPLAVTI